MIYLIFCPFNLLHPKIIIIFRLKVKNIWDNFIKRSAAVRRSPPNSEAKQHEIALIQNLVQFECLQNRHQTSVFNQINCTSKTGDRELGHKL